MGHPDLTSFGARVRAERERLGISQEDLADRAGLHRTYLGGVERGERNLGLLNLLRIAAALDIPASSLLLDVDSHTSKQASGPAQPFTRRAPRAKRR